MEQIKEVTNFHDAQFKKAFETYFTEIGIKLKTDSDVWDEITKDFKESGMKCVAVFENNEIIAFIMFQIEDLENEKNFFSQKYGFIRELWVKQERRRNGIGKELINDACSYFINNDAHIVLLTYEEDALKFYEKLGFKVDPTYKAKNSGPVISKLLY